MNNYTQIIMSLYVCFVLTETGKKVSYLYLDYRQSVSRRQTTLPIHSEWSKTCEHFI